MFHFLSSSILFFFVFPSFSPGFPSTFLFRTCWNHAKRNENHAMIEHRPRSQFATSLCAARTKTAEY